MKQKPIHPSFKFKCVWSLVIFRVFAKFSEFFTDVSKNRPKNTFLKDKI